MNVRSGEAKDSGEELRSSKFWYQLDIVKKAASISRGESQTWRGERFDNADELLFLVGVEYGLAGAFADELDANAGEFSERAGVTLGCVKWMAERVREGLAQRIREGK